LIAAERRKALESLCHQTVTRRRDYRSKPLLTGKIILAGELRVMQFARMS
jgi:hypothetical protein